MDHEEPTLSEILSGEKLRNTRVFIENVPKQCSSVEMKNLMEAELGSATVMNLRLDKGLRSGKGIRVIIDFYVSSVAEEAVNRFDGRVFRGRVLKIGYWDKPEAENWDEPSDDNMTSLISEKLPTSSKPTDGITPIPRNELGQKVRAENDQPTTDKKRLGWADWKRALLQLLATKGPLHYQSSTIIEFLSNKATESVQDCILPWPLGAFRNIKELKMIGPYLSHPKDEFQASAFCRRDGVACTYVEPWEPFFPGEIDSVKDFYKYVECLLGNFGAMWLEDVRLKVFALSLSPRWKARSLLDAPGELANNIICIHDTLYLLSVPRQQEAAMRATFVGRR